MRECGASATCGEHYRRLVEPHILRVDYLVILTVFEYSVLMNARRMGESVTTHYGFVGLHRHVHEVGYHAAGARYEGGIYRGVYIYALVAPERHNHLLQCGIAGPLAYAVYGDLHLTCAVHDTGYGVGGSHAQIVMTVRGYDGPVYI